LRLACIGVQKYLEQTGPGVSAANLKRVIAFMIDDLTLETPDLSPVRKMLLDFVNSKMRDDDSGGDRTRVILSPPRPASKIM